MGDIINAGNKQDKWTLKVTELLNWLNDNKQSVLTAGDNITLTPQEDGTVKISASGGGEGTVTDVQLAGTSIVDQNGVADIPVMKGATSQTVGEVGLVPTPAVADRGKFLKGDGTWGEAGGAVDDVQMNGQSIVKDKIASFNNYVEITQSEYDALPASKLTDGILYCVKDTGIVEGEKFAPVIYSLEEREVGVWHDGKPLYEKTIKIDNPTLTVDGIVRSHIFNYDSIGISDIDFIFTKECFEKHTSGSLFALNYSMTKYSSFTVESWGFLCPRPQKKDIYYCTIQSSVSFVLFTIRYTKTTDVPGSGQWATQGVPSVHYDGNEKVIGTWFGETLYEKTVRIEKESLSSGMNTIAHNISNVDTVVGYDGFIRAYSGSRPISYYLPDASYSFIVVYQINPTYIAYDISRDLLESTHYMCITIQYTKKP